MRKALLIIFGWTTVLAKATPVGGPVIPLPTNAPEAPPRTAHFVSAVQFAIHEPQVKRAQRVVREKFAQSMGTIPQLEDLPFDVRVAGNEVVFYVMTDADMNALIQQAMAMMIQNLDVKSRGRLSFYRAEVPQPMGGYLETVVNDKKSGIISVSAQAVPLRDLLAQLRDQLGGLSYLIPGECGDKRVDWRFEAQPTGAKPIDVVMTELGSLYGMKVQKRNNTHVFSGGCENPSVQEVQGMMVRNQPPFPGFPSPDQFQGGQALTRQVYFPVPPVAQ